MRNAAAQACGFPHFCRRSTYRVPVGTGLIYAMVIGLWGVVLIPLWLKSHEQVDEAKQVDRFRRAMTSLQRGPSSDTAEPVHREVVAKRAVRAGRPTPVPLTPAARRRRVLGALSLLQVLGVVALALGAPGALALLPAVLIASFLVLARSQVRRERARRAPAVAATPSQSFASFARAFVHARSARRPVPRAADPVAQAPAAPTVDAPASWQPVRTPAPSYVTAPAATAVPRAIDAGAGWTGAAMVDAARAMAEPPAVAEVLPVVAASSVDPDITAEIPAIRFTA